MERKKRTELVEYSKKDEVLNINDNGCGFDADFQKISGILTKLSTLATRQKLFSTINLTFGFERKSPGPAPPPTLWKES